MRAIPNAACAALAAMSLSACGSSYVVSDGLTQYSSDSPNRTIAGDPNTIVNVEHPVKGETTNFDENRAEWVGGAVAHKAMRTYRETRGDLPCNAIDVAALGVTVEKGAEQKGRWAEDWRADVCNVSYRFNVAGRNTFLGEDDYEIGEPFIVGVKAPAPIVAAAPVERLAEPAPASAMAPVAVASAPEPAAVTAPTLASMPAAPAVAAAPKPAPKPAVAAGNPNDPRLQLLPLSLRRVVARMSKQEQELYFSQYTE